MSLSDVRWASEEASAASVIRPLDGMSRESIASIPDGAHTLLVSLNDEGALFSGGKITAEEKARWIRGIPEDEEGYTNAALFYVDPKSLKDHDADFIGLETPEEIADRRIQENYPDPESLELAIDDGSLDADGIRAMLIQAVKDAREGLVRNPF